MIALVIVLLNLASCSALEAAAGFSAGSVFFVSWAKTPEAKLVMRRLVTSIIFIVFRSCFAKKCGCFATRIAWDEQCLIERRRSISGIGRRGGNAANAFVGIMNCGLRL